MARANRRGITRGHATCAVGYSDCYNRRPKCGGRDCRAMALSYSLHYLQRELFLGTCECLAPFLRAWQRAVNDATGAETAFAAARDEIGKIVLEQPDYA